jgi:hypothetical protein
MIIVVNHLTRMRQGNICIAGVDPETDRHIRPVTRWGSMTADLLTPRGGPFDMARVVDLGRTEAAAERPHMEDHLFKPWDAELVEEFPPEDFWALLYSQSKPGLRDIFGSDLKPVGGRSLGTEKGKGDVSLGCFCPSHRPHLYCRTKGASGKLQVRIRIHDDRREFDISVTDLRLYKEDHATPDQETIERVADRLSNRVAVILGVGLTRAYAGSAEYSNTPIHWLQVTNIHLADDPTWRLA